MKLSVHIIFLVVLQGACEKFSQNILDIFEAINEIIETCNTAMEREFCQLLEFVQVKNLHQLIRKVYILV